MSGIWIRSQNGNRLCFVKDIEIIDVEKLCNDWAIKRIFSHATYFPIYVDGAEIASYRTKKRALEVLDEIQDRIIEKDLSEFWGYELANSINPVYEMPKE